MIQHLKCFLLTLSEPHKEAEDCKQKNMSHNATLSQIHVTKSLAVAEYLQTVLVLSQVRVSWPSGSAGSGVAGRLLWTVDTRLRSSAGPSPLCYDQQPRPMSSCVMYEEDAGKIIFETERITKLEKLDNVAASPASHSAGY